MGGGVADPLLDLQDVLKSSGSLEDVFLLALLTRSFAKDGTALEPDWLYDITEDEWRIRGAGRKGLEQGRAALHERVRSDRTSIGGSDYPIGFPLGHIQFETAGTFDLYHGSTILTIRALTAGSVALEHLALAKGASLELSIIGVVRTSHAAEDLYPVLAGTAAGKRYLGCRLRPDDIVDHGLPAGMFDSLSK